MKKRNLNRDRWYLGARESKEKRRIRFYRRKTHRNRFGLTPLLVNEFNPHQKQPTTRRVVVELPERLDLDDNFEATVTHLTNVRRAAERKYRLGHLSFDRIRYVSPSAALLLASEVDQWNAATGGRLRAGHTTWHTDVKRVLCQHGFFKLLKLPEPKDLGSVINTTFLPFIRGSVGKRSLGGQLAKQLRQQIEQVAGVEIRKHLLFEGLSEAITNVSQHAYAEWTKHHLQRWWMSAAYQRDTDTVIVTFCDHGLTIPGTLPASKLFEKIRNNFGDWNDGQKIRAAMELGRSSTGEPGRGRGLQNFLEIIKQHRGSRLRIYSNHGVLSVSNSGEAGLSFDSKTVQTSLRGTLIEWQFVPKNTTTSDESFDS